MRSTFYFPHDYNARNDERITQLRMRCGAEGYGIFWMMIEAMHESDGELKDLAAFAFSINCPLETVVAVAKACLEVGLIQGKAEGGHLHSDRVKEQLKTREAYRDRQREFGRKGGLKRAKNQGQAKGSLARPSSQQGEERKEKESKVPPVSEKREPRIAPSARAAPADLDPGERERRFKQAALELGIDQHYADKTWSQGIDLSRDDRGEFVRKVNVFLGWARLPAKRDRARVIFGEIAGLVNDRGAMQSKLTPQEKAARELFRKETGQDLSAA